MTSRVHTAYPVEVIGDLGDFTDIDVDGSAFRGCENRARVAAMVGLAVWESRVKGFVLGAGVGVVGVAALLLAFPSFAAAFASVGRGKR